MHHKGTISTTVPPPFSIKKGSRHNYKSAWFFKCQMKQLLSTFQTKAMLCFWWFLIILFNNSARVWKTIKYFFQLSTQKVIIQKAGALSSFFANIYMKVMRKYKIKVLSPWCLVLENKGVLSELQQAQIPVLDLGRKNTRANNTTEIADYQNCYGFTFNKI